MDTNGDKSNDKQGDSDLSDFLDFESKLFEAFEELRLKREIERENDIIVRDLLQKRYELETKIEGERRMFKQEKHSLLEQIGALQKELDQKKSEILCDTANQQNFKKLYEDELHALREELQSHHAAKINLEKKCQGYESAIKLHTTFKETAMKQLNDLKQEIKDISVHHDQLKAIQASLKGNVTEANSLLEKYNLSNQHLFSVLSIIVKRNRFLASEIVKSESKLKNVNTITYGKQVLVPKDTIDFNDHGLSREMKIQHEKTLEVLTDLTDVLRDYNQTATENKENEKHAVCFKDAEVQVSFDNTEAEVQVSFDNIEAEVQVPFDNIEAEVQVPFDNIEAKVQVPFDHIEAEVQVPFDNIEAEVQVPFDNIEAEVQVPFDNIEAEVQVPFDNIEAEVQVSFDKIEKVI